MTRTIAIMAAIGANGALGLKGQMCPELVSPEDRRLFFDKTAGHVLLCGRQTAGTMYKPIAVKPNGRTLVSIENGKFVEAAVGCGPTWKEIGPYSLEAVAAHYQDRDITVCGGARLYAEAMRSELVTEMHISFIDAEPQADAFFPALHWVVNPHTIATGSIKNKSAQFWRMEHSSNFNGFVHRVYKRV